MDKKFAWIVYIIFATFYLISFITNLLHPTEWLIDNTLSFTLLTIIFLSRDWLKLSRFNFIFLNIALVVHNIGTFGWYGQSIFHIQYDVIVHFLGSIAAAFVVFDFLIQKLHIKKSKIVKFTVIDEHMTIMILLVIAFVAMLGVGIE